MRVINFLFERGILMFMSFLKDTLKGVFYNVDKDVLRLMRNKGISRCRTCPNLYDKTIFLMSQQSSPLIEQEIQKVLQEVDKFFLDYSPIEIKKHMGNFLECALTTDNPQFNSANERSAVWVFNKQLEKLLDAIYVLHVKSK